MGAWRWKKCNNPEGRWEKVAMWAKPGAMLTLLLWPSLTLWMTTPCAVARTKGETKLVQQLRRRETEATPSTRRALKKQLIFYSTNDTQQDFMMTCMSQMKPFSSANGVSQKLFAAFVYGYCAESPAVGLSCATPKVGSNAFPSLSVDMQLLFVSNQCPVKLVAKLECLKSLNTKSSTFYYKGDSALLCAKTLKMMYKSGMLIQSKDKKVMKDKRGENPASVVPSTPPSVAPMSTQPAGANAPWSELSPTSSESELNSTPAMPVPPLNRTLVPSTRVHSFLPVAATKAPSPPWGKDKAPTLLSSSMPSGSPFTVVYGTDKPTGDLLSARPSLSPSTAAYSLTSSNPSFPFQFPLELPTSKPSETKSDLPSDVPSSSPSYRGKQFATSNSPSSATPSAVVNPAAPRPPHVPTSLPYVRYWSEAPSRSPVSYMNDSAGHNPATSTFSAGEITTRTPFPLPSLGNEGPAKNIMPSMMALAGGATFFLFILAAVQIWKGQQSTRVGKARLQNYWYQTTSEDDASISTYQSTHMVPIRSADSNHSQDADSGAQRSPVSIVALGSESSGRRGPGHEFFPGGRAVDRVQAQIGQNTELSNLATRVTTTTDPDRAKSSRALLGLLGLVQGQKYFPAHDTISSPTAGNSNVDLTATMTTSQANPTVVVGIVAEKKAKSTMISRISPEVRRMFREFDERMTGAFAEFNAYMDLAHRSKSGRNEKNLEELSIVGVYLDDPSGAKVPASSMSEYTFLVPTDSESSPSQTASMTSPPMPDIYLPSGTESENSSFSSDSGSTAESYDSSSVNPTPSTTSSSSCRMEMSDP